MIGMNMTQATTPAIVIRSPEDELQSRPSYRAPAPVSHDPAALEHEAELVVSDLLKYGEYNQSRLANGKFQAAKDLTRGKLTSNLELLTERVKALISEKVGPDVDLLVILIDDSTGPGAVSERREIYMEAIPR